MELFGKKSRPAFLGYTEDKVLQENAVEMKCNAAKTLLLLLFYFYFFLGGDEEFSTQKLSKNLLLVLLISKV